MGREWGRSVWEVGRKAAATTRIRERAVRIKEIARYYFKSRNAL